MVLRRIRELREDSDLTQAEVGKALHLTQRAYSYYERGERTIPPEVLISLARYYHTTVDYILELTDRKR